MGVRCLRVAAKRPAMQPGGHPVRGMGMESTDESIYNKHRDDLVAFAAGIAGADNAEDVLSAVMVKVLRRGGLVRLDEPRPYLFKAVLNEARSVLRGSPNLPLLSEPQVHDSREVEVLDAVMRLPLRQRAAVFLVYWEGESIADAAALMGTAPGTVKRYLHIARRHLKGVL